MPSLTSARPRRVAHSTLAGVTAFAIVAALGAFGLRAEEQRHDEELRSEVVITASRVRADLEKALEQRIFMVEGLAGFAVADLVADETIDDGQFAAYAALLEQDSGVPVRSLQLAPDGVVTHVHPLAGNEAAIGHDLLEDPARRDAVMEAVRLRKPMVAGPFELLQGGQAIVVRKPVFWPTGTSAGEFWGLATMVADLPPLLAQVGLDGSDESLAAFDVALRGQDQSGASGMAFHGPDETFTAEAAPVLFDVTLPAGAWQLALTPDGGWDRWTWPRRDVYLLSVLLLAALFSLLVSRYAASRSASRLAADELERLVETANAPIAELNLDGTVVRWNSEMAALTGLDASVVVGRRAFTPEGDGEGLLEGSLTSTSYADVRSIMSPERLSQGDVDALEVTIARKDGKETPVLVNLAVKRDGRGTPVGAVVVCQDVSARIEADRIRAENHAIERTARLKDEFLANMSHELRTPLNGIIGLSSILGKRTFGELNDKQAEYVTQIATSGRHLLSLINDVLDLAKIEANTDEMEREPVDLGLIARQAVDVLREVARGRGQQISVDVGSAATLVSGDARRLKQIALNLLSNALKFTPADGEVGIRVGLVAGEAVLEVWDTGIGIAKDKHAMLFEPFQQIDSSLNRTYDGSGLGLALTAKLAALHDGRVAVESEPGRGSSFTVTIPAMAPEPLTASSSGGPAASGDVGRPRSSELLVLVAEDNQVNRGLVVDFLESNGIRVIEAVDGVEAVELARAHQPDLVLMDIQMPVRDGLEATRLLKADPAMSGTPVIAVTALAMAGDADRCLSAGCDAYMAKPLDLDEMLAVIQQFTTEPAAI